MNLQLSLKREWFDMTKAGVKTEDYREITPYWCARLMQDDEGKSLSEKYWKQEYFEGGEIKDYHISELIDGGHFYLKPFTTNTMTLGYPKATDTERIIQFEHAGIEIRTGNPDWGAEEGKIYFVIKHGNEKIF